jgi:hypothetical protein
MNLSVLLVLSFALLTQLIAARSGKALIPRDLAASNTGAVVVIHVVAYVFCRIDGVELWY